MKNPTGAVGSRGRARHAGEPYKKTRQVSSSPRSYKKPDGCRRVM